MRRKKIYLCDIVIAPTIHKDDASVVGKHMGDDMVDVAVFPREKPGSKEVYLRQFKGKPCDTYEVRSGLTAGDILYYL